MDLEAAAAVLGVHYQTAYRWVRNGELPAVRVGQAYELDPDVVEAVRQERQQRRRRQGEPAIAWKLEQAALARWLVNGSEGAARRQFDRLQCNGASVVSLCAELVSPALRHLHAGWAAGDLHGADVAAAAELCERLIGALAAPPRGRPRGLAVVAGPVADRHRLPSLMATAALRANRWRVQHLGSGVPARDLVEFVEETVPDLVVVTFTVGGGAADDFSAAVSGVTAVPVVVGGSGESLTDLLRRADAVTRAKRAGRLVATA